MRTLSQFVNEIRDQIDAFEAYWKACHVDSPAYFPMFFADDDEGQWWEQFIAFCSLEE